MSFGSRIVMFVLFFAAAIPTGVFAASVKTPVQKPAPIEISGWIPYWRTATGTADAITHIDAFKEINPFGYTVKNDGTLFDAMNVSQESWQTLIRVAREKKVRVIPTVMWSNTNAIDAVLRSPKLRKAHINEIVKVVKENGFDGIDIDYEGKKADTKKYFSLFLRGLYKAMGKKWVMCTIEARTPLDSRFSKIPKDVQFANDFASINAYCDRVRIMTYDQGTIDLKLNNLATGPYIPVADPKWVEKVIKLTAQSIAKKKIVIGVATYGYGSDITRLTDGYRYDLLWSFNPKFALDLAGSLNIVPQRNGAGELSFMFTPTTTPTLPPQAGDSIQTNNAPLATTSESISEATSTPIVASLPLRILWWSDAQAIRDKVSLARKLGVRGVAIFKIDGGEDPAIWEALK